MQEQTADQPRIVIIGAGPTGLGAAYRLRELGHRNFVVLEARDKVGGLASSETSPNGFTYDIGGHVLFSHYAYFDALFDKLMGDDYQELVREAWVWMEKRFLPYPFQNNIRHLSRETVLECLLGLIEAQTRAARSLEVHELRGAHHGRVRRGIAKHFMMPYNFKVWAHPPRMMNKEWIGERVSVVDIARVLSNVILDKDDAGWGPNSTFKYPRLRRHRRAVRAHRPVHRGQPQAERASRRTSTSSASEVVLADGTRERLRLAACRRCRSTS